MWDFQKPIEELHIIFNQLNKEFFNDELPIPAITIQSRGKRNALGWCTTNPIWTDIDSKDTRYEINICAENLNMNVLAIAEIVIHEMVHYYGDLHGIKTTSRGGTFHNKKFKELAEQFGLEVTKTKKYGFADTKLKEESYNKISVFNFKQDAFIMFRLNDEGKINKKRGSIKHTCPNCNNVARTTKEMKLICGECNEDMECDDENVEN